MLPQFEANYPGLELGWFTNVKYALGVYVDRTAAAMVKNPKTEYDAELTAIDATDAISKDPSPDKMEKLGEATGRLQDAGSAPELVAALRAAFRNPICSFKPPRGL